MKICLDNIDKVKEFVKKISKVDAEVDLSLGVCTVDAKSIMGIFSLDLQQPLNAKVCAGDRNAAYEVLRQYAVLA